MERSNKIKKCKKVYDNFQVAIGCSKLIAKHRCYWSTSIFCSIYCSDQIIVIVFIYPCVNPTIFVTLVGFKSKQTYFDTMTFIKKHALLIAN